MKEEEDREWEMEIDGAGGCYGAEGPPLLGFAAAAGWSFPDLVWVDFVSGVGAGHSGK